MEISKDEAIALEALEEFVKEELDGDRHIIINLLLGSFSEEKALESILDYKLEIEEAEEASHLSRLSLSNQLASYKFAINILESIRLSLYTVTRPLMFTKDNNELNLSRIRVLELIKNEKRWDTLKVSPLDIPLCAAFHDEGFTINREYGTTIRSIKSFAECEDGIAASLADLRGFN